MPRFVSEPKLHKALQFLLEGSSDVERHSLANIFRSSLAAYETAMESSRKIAPDSARKDASMLAQSINNLGMALRYMSMLQMHPQRAPDEAVVKEAWLCLRRAQWYANGKTLEAETQAEADDLPAFLANCDFSDCAKYQVFLRESICCVAECLVSLGDILCQGENFNIGLRGGILMGIRRASFFVRGVRLPKIDLEEKSDGPAQEN